MLHTVCVSGSLQNDAATQQCVSRHTWPLHGRRPAADKRIVVGVAIHRYGRVGSRRGAAVTKIQLLSLLLHVSLCAAIHEPVRTQWQLGLGQAAHTGG